MLRLVQFCLFWIFLNAVSSIESGYITDKDLEKLGKLNEAPSRNGNLLTKLLTSPYRKRHMERQNDQDDVALADDRKGEETLEAFVERALLERKLNSVLEAWLSTKLQQLEGSEEEKDPRGWGNSGWPTVQ